MRRTDALGGGVSKRGRQRGRIIPWYAWYITGYITGVRAKLFSKIDPGLILRRDLEMGPVLRNARRLARMAASLESS